jgi:valyl-tRNA synthetase
MLAPVTPHVAEEFWYRLNEKGFLASYILPDITVFDDDWYILAQEEYLRSVIDSARNIKGLAQRHSDEKITALTIQTSPEWKKNLAKEAINLEKDDFSFKKEGINYLKSLHIFTKDELRAELFQTWNSLTMGSKKRRGRVFTWSDNEKKLINSELNESEFLESNKIFLMKELNLQSISIYTAGEGEDVAGKAKVAFPLDPGLSFT